MSAALPIPQSWQTAFDAQPNVGAFRKQAFADFVARGLPTGKLDAWKYTDLRRLTLRQFRLPTDGSVANVDDALLPLTNGARLVFVDGLPASSLARRADGVSITATSHCAKLGTDAFDLLNAALSSRTERIEVAAKSSPVEPIYIAFIWTRGADGLMAHPRLRLTLGSNSKATLIEHHVGLNVAPTFTNSIFDIDVAEAAALEHIRVQTDGATNFNIGSIRAKVARGANYVNHHYVAGAALARADIEVQLCGENASTELHGLVLAQSTQHLDVRTCIEHVAPNARSREDYRGIADQRGRVVFNGKVIVAKDAQRTDAAQSSRNLLLSDQAEIDTRPELEIYADDVKCAHGATVGQLDAAALFYLQSRGIDSNEARALLTHAFATAVIERLPVAAVRDYVLAQFLRRMRAGAVQ